MSKRKLVVLTGAGISAESGLRTFRDSDGLWEGYNVADVATPRAWKRDPQLVLDFYNMRRRDVLQAQPNEAHFTLARMEQDFEVTIITQNIDDLHERGGSTEVLHLHGEILRMRSEADESYRQEIYTDIALGDLAPDGYQWRPDIVWFEEPVPMIEEAIPIIQSADFFAVVGTSLVVYPAAGLLNYAYHSVPKFIVDKKVPQTRQISNLTIIEQPATIGVPLLHQFLLEAIK
ncbi:MULTISPECIES: SIR2 family NAD-dependent protein deacylase [unclassified Paraflavitalea]|jgi:NAD-dependent deacetylase|uniref:SIR2 family NAD-dependent protein deacylase n=1 Tax=unclassified Paraflavitalea TaxID=2798305 RepID=UPI003D335A74